MPYLNEEDVLSTLSVVNDTNVDDEEDEEVTPTLLPTSPVPFLPTAHLQQVPSQSPFDRACCVMARIARKAPTEKQNRPTGRRGEKELSPLPNQVLLPSSPYA